MTTMNSNLTCNSRTRNQSTQKDTYTKHKTKMKKEKTKGKKSESNATRTNEKEERELKEKVGTYQKNAKLISISTNIQKRTQKPASERASARA